MAFTELNRFAPEVLNGQLALVNGNQPNVLNVMFKATSNGQTLKAGDAVYFATGKSLTPLVNKAASDGDVLGVVLVNQKKDTFVDGDMVEVACRGSIVYMQTTDAIERGAEFGNIGIALDDADAGEFTRVSIIGVL